MAHARARTIPTPTRPATLADLLGRLGVRADRVRLEPPPGAATERDLLAVNDRKDGLCELVEGTLVEKAMGCDEAQLAALLIIILGNFVRERRLGVLLTPDGPIRLAEGLVRLPDIAFLSWDRIPGRRLPLPAVLGVAPDLAVEVLSKSNTRKEMDRKLREYFAAGVRLAWVVDPKGRSVRVHTGPGAGRRVEGDRVLDGGDVLPGFALPLAGLFDEAGWPGPG